MKLNHNKQNIVGIVVVLLFCICSSCNKEWLDQKPNSKLAVLNTLEQYQSFMDNSLLYSATLLNVVGGDSYYIPTRNQGSLDASDVRYYLWANNGYASSFSPDWTSAYQAIFICNSTIEGLKKIDKSVNETLWNEVYGSALFYRGFIYYQLAQVFSKPYDSVTANTDKGVPVRLETNVNNKVGRGTVQQLYDQILKDLVESIELLPVNPTLFKTRPSKIASYAVLARYWLAVGDYQKAKINADLALAINSSLLDYNMVASSTLLGFSTIPFTNNPEVFLYNFVFQNVISTTNAIVDSSLYASYSSNDLRKSIFFRLRTGSEYSFKGSYRGQGGSASDLFTAPAVDELYLIRAEANARLNDVSEAMNDLNSLLVKRYKTGTFIPLVANSASNALSLILVEREKELLFRGVRWSDLRRLNKQTATSKVLTRVYQNTSYNLVPNSNWYIWPIPANEILYSGIEQNPR